jgi:catechol 2,3-dioxygenase-like lactoylglutathione lyase family enzyme
MGVMIESLSHITLIVKDLEKMTRILKTVFDAEEIYSSNGKNYSLSDEKYFMIGETWIAVMKGEPLPEHSYNHIAFKIPEAEFDTYVSRIKECGLEIKPGRKRIEGESRSVYFYDDDNHLFELHTGTLQDRLLRYSKE